MSPRIRTIGRRLYEAWGVLLLLGLVVRVVDGAWHLPAIFAAIGVAGVLLLALERRVYGPLDGED